MVAPGHEDPGLGEFRTDAPTTDPLAVNLTKTIVISLGWKAWCFDVETAFLSGKATARETYVRAPKDGLPAIDTTPYVQPFALLQVLKSIYGLTEAPRLWYLMAREVFEKAGYKELRMSKSTFVLIDEAGLSQSICNLHVDDGFLVGNPSDKGFQAAFAAVLHKGVGVSDGQGTQVPWRADISECRWKRDRIHGGLCQQFEADPCRAQRS